MSRAPGHDPGHQELPPGLTWQEYVDWLVGTEGTLAAVAQKLAARRGYKDDAGSVERALRRLRTRENLAGGTWGLKALAAFGLPAAASARARWMGAYHSRFTDLPVPLCLDLVRLWDRPPISRAGSPLSRLRRPMPSSSISPRAINAPMPFIAARSPARPRRMQSASMNP